MTDEEKLAEARRLCPEGYVVVPRKASSIMALRGFQARVGWSEPYADSASEYFKFEKGDSQLADALAPQNRYDDDDREYWLAASIWEGCIKGMEEWQHVRAKDGPTAFVTSWERPCIDTIRRRIEAKKSPAPLAQTGG
jgi:hypothetical protein